MTDCILKVFNNLMCASLPNAAQKTKRIEEKADWNIRSLFLVGKEGALKERQRKQLCIVVSSLGFTTLFLSTYNFLCCVQNISSCPCLSHISAVNTQTAQVSSGKKDFSQRKGEIQWRRVCECVLMCFFRFPIMAALLPFSVFPPSSVVSRMDTITHTRERASSHTI